MRAENFSLKRVAGAAKLHCFILCCAALHFTFLLASSSYGLNATTQPCPTYGRNVAQLWPEQAPSELCQPATANCAFPQLKNK